MIRGILLATILAPIALWPGAGSADTWLDACIAIQPAIACKPENRAAIELAMQRCSTAADKPACHRRELSQQSEPRAPAPMPTILRGK